MVECRACATYQISKIVATKQDFGGKARHALARCSTQELVLNVVVETVESVCLVHTREQQFTPLQKGVANSLGRAQEKGGG
jgi:hypothetical protein